MQEIDLKAEEQDFRTKEAYRTLRTNIEFCGEDVKIVCITSCTPNEGKSSVAYDLACAFAQSGKHTLLIDADLRKSVMRSRIKRGRVRFGLTDYLAGKTSLEAAICKTSQPNFFMLFAGPFPPNPSELLGNARFERLVNAVKSSFHVIIVDTPPLYSVIDTAVVAKRCDGAIIVVESGAASYHIARRVKEQLEVSGCRILGCVLNKVSASGKGYYGKYYEAYYGDYYQAEEGEG